MVILLACCWRWIAGHSLRYPVKVSGHASEHGDMGRIGTSVPTTEAHNTYLNAAINEKRSATVSLQRLFTGSLVDYLQITNNIG